MHNSLEENHSQQQQQQQNFCIRRENTILPVSQYIHFQMATRYSSLGSSSSGSTGSLGRVGRRGEMIGVSGLASLHNNKSFINPCIAASTFLTHFELFENKKRRRSWKC
jgi:hypothetical protein